MQKPKEKSKSDEELKLKNKLKIYTQELSSYTEEKKGIEKMIENLQNKIMEMGGTQFRTQSTKVDLITERIKLLESKIDKSRLNISKNQKQSQYLNENIKDVESIIINTKNEIGNIGSRITNTNKKLETLQKQKTEIEENLENINDMKVKKNKKFEKLKERINEFQIIQINYDNTLKDAQHNKTKTESYLKFWIKKMESLIENFDINNVEKLRLTNVENWEKQIQELERKCI